MYFEDRRISDRQRQGGKEGTFSRYSSRCLEHAHQSNGHKKLNINLFIILKKILKVKNKILSRFNVVNTNISQN